MYQMTTDWTNFTTSFWLHHFTGQKLAFHLSFSRKHMHKYAPCHEKLKSNNDNNNNNNNIYNNDNFIVPEALVFDIICSCHSSTISLGSLRKIPVKQNLNQSTKTREGGLNSSRSTISLSKNLATNLFCPVEVLTNMLRSGYRQWSNRKRIHRIVVPNGILQ